MRLKAAHGYHFRVSRIVLLRVNDHALRAPHPELGEHLCQPRLNDKAKIIQQEQRATTPQVGLKHHALAGPIGGAWIGIDDHVTSPGNVWLCGGEDGAHLKAEVPGVERDRGVDVVDHVADVHHVVEVGHLSSCAVRVASRNPMRVSSSAAVCRKVG